MQTSVAPETRSTRPAVSPPGPSRARLTFELFAIVGAVALAVGLLLVGPSSRAPMGWRIYGDPADRFEVAVPGSYATTTVGNVVRFSGAPGMPVLSLETYDTTADAAQLARSDLQNYANLTAGELQLATQHIGEMDASRLTHTTVGTTTTRVYVNLPDGVAVLVATWPAAGSDTNLVDDYVGSFTLR